MSVVRARLSSLGAYWSAELLGVAAVVLLAVGTPAKAALAGAGFAFIGAALTRTVDLAKERRAEAAQAGEAFRRDMDETRRLAYMALVAGPASSRDPMLVATLVNALAHHGRRVEPDLAAEYLQNLDRDESQRWLREQIDQINAELNS